MNINKLIGILVALVVIVVSTFYFRYGTLSPCEALRITAREDMAKSPNSLQRAFSPAIPNALLDPMLEAKFGGPLTPARCLYAVIDPGGAAAK